MNTIQRVATVTTALLIAACASTPKQPAAPAAAPAPAPAAATAAAIANINGAWLLSVDTPMGTREMKLNATQNGETFTGSIASPRGELPISGTVKGNEVAFMMKVNAQGMDLQVDYTGTIEGDTMKGKAKFGDFGEGEFTGKKQ